MVSHLAPLKKRLGMPIIIIIIIIIINKSTDLCDYQSISYRLLKLRVYVHITVQVHLH